MNSDRHLRSTLLALVAVACGGSTTTEFPAGLTPFMNEAPEPAPVGGDTTPEALGTTIGDGGDFEYAHGRGYIHAPIAAVWEGMKNPATVIDRRRVAKYEVTRDVETGYDVSFRVHNTVNDIVTVEFDMTWRQGVVQGTVEEPEVVVARSAKTAGTAYIDRLEDSVVLTKISDDVTQYEHVREVDAATSTPEDIENFVKDLFASIVAVAHGRPLPTY